MTQTPPQRLELTWFNKDKALIPTETGKYGYTWVDPSDPRYCETHYLEYVDTVTGVRGEKKEGITYSERADLPPQDDNLLILGESGDILEALTRVPELKAKYLGKVKCVYIDPPFNTAQTFANYEDNLEHSVWLTMMRDRLIHLRNLLSDDGSIWIHLDNKENHRMRMLLDEVFGSGNFVCEFTWQKRTSKSNDADVSISHDYITCYSKDRTTLKGKLNKIPYVSSFKNPDNDPRGPWKPAPFAAPGIRPNMEYPITLPSGRVVTPPAGRCWPRPLEGYQELLMDNKIWFGTKGDAAPQVKRFESEIESTIVPQSLWLAIDVGTTTSAKKEIQRLFPEIPAFSTPKPERLLERIIHIATDPGDIVLDTFAGSGTTAAVAQKMGRRWVTCELREDNFTQFTRPRLEKVVRGEDPGGITCTKGERVDATETGLPEGLEPENAQKLTSLLDKAIKNNPKLKASADIKALKALVKTAKSPDTVNWLGGGGFTIARLSSTCYDYMPDLNLAVLTENATGDVLKKSVAAHLGFTLVDDQPPFTGKRNREYLAVIEGVLNESKINDIMALLPEGHSATLAATEMTESTYQKVRSFKNGSRVIHVPFDMFRITDTRQEK